MFYDKSQFYAFWYVESHKWPMTSDSLVYIDIDKNDMWLACCFVYFLT